MTLHPFVKDMYNNVYRKKRNCMVAVTGPVGTGKSYLSLYLACTLDPAFQKVQTEEEAYELLKSRIVRQPTELISLIDEKKLKKGSVVIFDEAGTSVDSRRWFSFNNKIIRYILQTFRYKQLITIFTLPSLTFLDAQARRAIEWYIETSSVDFNHKLTRSWVRRFQANPRSGEIYRKRPKYTVNGQLVSFDQLYWPKPRKIIANAYEKFAKEFKDKIRKDLQAEIDEKKKEEQAEKPINLDEKAREYWEKYGKVPKIAEIRIETELSYNKANLLRTKIKQIADEEAA